MLSESHLQYIYCNFGREKSSLLCQYDAFWQFLDVILRIPILFWLYQLFSSINL